MTEIQFHGWPATALDGYPVGATELTATQAGEAVALSWNANGAAASTFVVERKTGDGEWQGIASGLDAAEYTDTTVACDGTVYSYRVVASRGEAVAYSATAEISPYRHGEGEGLHAVYRFPYVSTDADDSVVAVATNAVYVAAAAADEERAIIAGVEGSHTNVFVSWTGKLIVPFDGAYRFYATADDAVSVYIDDINVLCNPSASVWEGKAKSDDVSLKAGEHDILVQYWQGAGASGCTLSWGGAVVEEPIPASQLVPVPPTGIPEPWEGARTFTRDAASLFPGNVRVNQDGSIDLSFCGEDLYKYPTGYFYMWRRYSGDFTFITKMSFIGPARNGQKGGVMVRSSLDAAAPFESLIMRRNSWDMTCKRRTTKGGGIVEPDTLDGKGNWTVRAASTVWFRVTRRGNVFTSSYRTATSPWTELYKYEDKNGIYGDTVYIGPCTTYLQLNDVNWGTHVDAIPYYLWRFSDVKLRTPAGARLILR